MFATQDLAARIDRAEGRLCAGIAQLVASTNPALAATVTGLGGGVAVFAGPGSPTNKMIGLGFESLPTDDELGNVEDFFAGHGSPLQAEVSTLADPALHARLVARGYEPRGFENVLGHPLTSLASTWPEDITVAPTPPDGVSEWIDTLVAAFATPDTGGVGGDALPLSDDLRQWLRLTVDVRGVACVSATVDGRLVGGGSLRLDEGVAQFCGAATLPGFRRRGVQTAVLRWRLSRARARGCDVAVVTTQPASKSQQNVQREGFHLLYARQLLVKPPR
jgi:GNAT superfamily N-acetyltransferase